MQFSGKRCSPGRAGAGEVNGGIQQDAPPLFRYEFRSIRPRIEWPVDDQEQPGCVALVTEEKASLASMDIVKARGAEILPVRQGQYLPVSGRDLSIGSQRPENPSASRARSEQSDRCDSEQLPKRQPRALRFSLVQAREDP